jgi:hypothetical protein
MPSPSPTDLDDDPALDQEEKTGIVDTTETLQIDKTFIVIPDIFQQYQVEQNLLIKGTAQMIIKLGVAGDGTYATTLTKVDVDIGYVSEDGSFTSKAMRTSTPNISQAATTYKTFSGQALFCDIPDYSLTRYAHPAVRLRVYAYVASGSAGGKVKIICRRGEADSYLQACIGLKEYQE